MSKWRRSGWSWRTRWSPRRPIIVVLVNPTNRMPSSQSRDLQGGGPHPRAAAPCPACQHRTRLRYGLRNLGPTASRRARDRHRCILQLAGANSSRHWRVRHAVPAIYQDREFCRGRRPDELRRQSIRTVPSGRRLHRPHPQRAKSPPTCRCSRTSVNAIRHLAAKRAHYWRPIASIGYEPTAKPS